MFKLKNQREDSFFDGKNYDQDQRKIILDSHEHLLVVAGAGSGKTTTIIGKINYLIERKGYREEEILCLSFTNETVNNLKERINYHVPVFTFHKLALSILREYHYSFHIARDNLLNYIVDEYFASFVDEQKLSWYLQDKKNKSKELKILKMLIISFIRCLKSNNVEMIRLKKIKKQLFKREKVFYLFALEIFSLYCEELQSENKIDFDDMINYATYVMKNNLVDLKYRYIIIDEYQDISFIRFNLIQELVGKLHANLMCVGDDYQAIYGFSGSKVSFFIDFKKYFPSAYRLDIRNTYRNSYQLATIAHRFVQKNPYQLRKRVWANFLYSYPVILVYYEQDKYLDTYKKLLDYLYLEKERNILVLGRYNDDLEFVKKKNSQTLNIRYLTIHMAKGLEEENVIVLKMDDSYLGFPSKIMDYPLLDLIKKEEEEMAFAEERRLFYVALTRAKKRVYLLVSKDKPSIFIQEIKKYCLELILE